MKIELKYRCELSWDDLVGEGDTRFCDACGQHVHFISKMQRAEAAQFLASQSSNGEGLCIMQWVQNGKTSFADDPDRRLERQREGVSNLVSAAVLALTVAMPLSMLAPATCTASVVETVVGKDWSSLSPVGLSTYEWLVKSKIEADCPPVVSMGVMF